MDKVLDGVLDEILISDRADTSQFALSLLKQFKAIALISYLFYTEHRSARCSANKAPFLFAQPVFGVHSVAFGSKVLTEHVFQRTTVQSASLKPPLQRLSDL